MATITTVNRTEPSTSTVQTISQADSRRIAAVAAFEGKAVETSNHTSSNLRQDAPGEAAKGGGAATLQTPSSEEPINDSSTKAASDHLTQLANREKAAWAQIKQLKAEKAAIEQDKTKALEGRLTKEEAVRLLRQDPTQLGLTYEDLGQLFLSQGQPVDPNVAKLQAQIEELKGSVKQANTAAEEQTKAAYAQALKQIDLEAKALVSKNDAYEVTRSQGAENAITKLIELTYQEEGVLMDVEEAAAQVEAHLEAEAVTLFQKSTKLKAKLMPEANQSTQKLDQSHAQPRTTTLTQAMSQASNKPLNRRDRAVLAFQGKLKD